MNPYEERIVDAEGREDARDVFHEWCEMQVSVHDEVELDSLQNDVATFHITTADNHRARDLLVRYGVRGRTPLRAIGLDAVDEDRVEVKILLAELTPPEDENA